MEQGSTEWIEARLGRVTASRIADVMARTKSGWGAGRANYKAELVAERLTGAAGDSWQSPAMRWGIETEPLARDAYAFFKGVEVKEVGFVPHPAIDMTGASPDGLVGADGLVEIKAPNTATHIDTLLNGTVPDKYVKQMQWQMACTGRAWCDFVSFDPRLPESMQAYIERFPRDDAAIAEIETAVADFLAEVDETVAALRAKFERRAAA